MEPLVDGGYDAGYLECDCFWGRNPGSLVKTLADLLDVVGMTILDAGCGEGKNATYLASRGAKVRAVDISELALRNARHIWGTPSNVAWEIGDIRDIRLSREHYDVIVAYGLLHCLPTAEAIYLTVRQFQEATARGGYNVVCAFNDRQQELIEAHPTLRACLVTHDEYLALYKTWDVLLAADSDLFESHPDKNIPHVHSLTRLIARKPE